MISIEYPNISCVCVTKDRPHFIKNTIKLFDIQNYTKKDLYIISQGSEKSNIFIKNYINSLNRKDIHFFTIQNNVSLGYARNAVVELAKGPIICQWDDDDIYHPCRLTTQYDNLRKSSKNLASLYFNFLKYFYQDKKMFWCDWSNEEEISHRFLCGSIMFKKEVFYMFDNFYPSTGSQSDTEEDLNVLEKILNVGEVAGVKEGYQYIYVYHGDNVYDLDHHNLTIDTSWGKKIFDKEKILNNKKNIQSSIELLPHTFRPVKMNSSEELVFEY